MQLVPGQRAMLGYKPGGFCANSVSQQLVRDRDLHAAGVCLEKLS
jgi:hypothetical protein